MTEQVDVVVLGLGVGGERVAGKLAEAGLSVVGIESELLGGECPYWGCIPSKMIVRAANMLTEARRIPGVAGTSTVTPDWSPVAQRIRAEATDNWDDRVAVERFEGQGGRFVRGIGRFESPSVVAVGDARFVATRAVVIATGSTALIPPIPGLTDVDYWTNRDAIKTETLPESMIVLGGGAIGLELAQAFARFGVRVTLVEGEHKLLAREESEACGLLQEVLGGEGIDIRIGTTATGARRDDDGVVLDLSDGGEVSAARVLVATGRKVDLAKFGAAAAGLDESARMVHVDGTMRAAPGIWAVGDITAEGMFTHIAVYQADIAVADILGENPEPADYHALPRVTFTDPEVGAVGMTEADARKAGINVRTGITQVPSSSRGWIHKVGNEGLIKLVEDADRGVLVGATSMGPWGGEVLGLLALAVQAKIPTHDLRHMIYAYPTFHRGIEDALRDLATK
ncbi:MAG: NAD(P)/FAD-dependent oxidoreductase [Acidimicrobiia bacterium]|nr:NAD(P)/FAD-dependent oxidoreductase [Acidimicrobiia bacterium]